MRSRPPPTVGRRGGVANCACRLRRGVAPRERQQSARKASTDAGLAATIRAAAARRRRRAAVRRRAAPGRSVHKVAQLREVTALQRGDFECRDAAERASAVAEHFRRRWGDAPYQRLAALDMALAMDGVPPTVSATEVFEAASALRRQAVVDFMGLCPAAAELAATAAPEATAAAFASLIASTACMSDIVM